ncbi:hypothetical protein KSP35_14520 [Aquihabitans sp. G128]|uniref:hypothetical protein n=1 Tax=Aquihabitans sp. G128 TaxID=2849779 RepID=UPI001C223D8C|nr:hypothetical protein [Aquihabitans sp. G128]QXC59596.1 hypothetical protein KSP35_14520 [Aquihabitans sp. G128]
MSLPVGLGTMTVNGRPLWDSKTYTAAQKAKAKRWMVCQRIDDGSSDSFLTYPPVPTAGMVLAVAQQQLVLPTPEVRTSPPRNGAIQLVGVPVWFWVTNAQPAATTATVPGLSVTLNATPQTTHVKVSGGTGKAATENASFDCIGGGTPYVEGRDAAWSASDCAHAFDWNGTFTVEVTVDWALTWTATNGQAGTLPAVPRTTTFTLTIQQAQAVAD